jgi:hypothetical protein
MNSRVTRISRVDHGRVRITRRPRVRRSSLPRGPTDFRKYSTPRSRLAGDRRLLDESTREGGYARLDGLFDDLVEERTVLNARRNIVSD